MGRISVSLYHSPCLVVNTTWTKEKIQKFRNYKAELEFIHEGEKLKYEINKIGIVIYYNKNKYEEIFGKDEYDLKKYKIFNTEEEYIKEKKNNEDLKKLFNRYYKGKLTKEDLI